jgi:hypothetical protein
MAEARAEGELKGWPESALRQPCTDNPGKPSAIMAFRCIFAWQNPNDPTCRELIMRWVLRGGAFCCAMTVSLVLAWYSAMALARDRAMQVHDVPRGGRNALLHSIAGAETYTAFRRIGFGRERALRSAEFLGYCNEWMEHWTKRMDVTAEVYKDLHNNLYGVVAAQWLREAGYADTGANRRAVLAWLVKQRHMPWWPQDMDNGLSTQRFETGPAMRFYEARRAELRNEMAWVMDRERASMASHLKRAERSLPPTYERRARPPQ